MVNCINSVTVVHSVGKTTKLIKAAKLPLTGLIAAQCLILYLFKKCFCTGLHSEVFLLHFNAFFSITEIILYMEDDILCHNKFFVIIRNDSDSLQRHIKALLSLASLRQFVCLSTLSTDRHSSFVQLPVCLPEK